MGTIMYNCRSHCRHTSPSQKHVIYTSRRC